MSVTIDSYDEDTRMLTYTVKAKEPDSMLMYYDLDTQTLAEDEEKGFMHLNVWSSGKDSMQGTYIVPEGYSGPFVARVYNNYEKFTDTDPVTIPAEFIRSETAQSTQPSLSGTGSGPVPDTPKVTVADESGATWTLEGALNAAKENGFIIHRSDDNKAGNRNYIGLVVAFIVAGSMLVAAICMGVVTHRKRQRKRRKRNR